MKDADTAELLICHLCCIGASCFQVSIRDFDGELPVLCKPHSSPLSWDQRGQHVSGAAGGENRGRRLMAKKSGGASQCLLLWTAAAV